VHLRAGSASGLGRQDLRAQRQHQDGAPNIIIPRRQTVLKMRFTGRLRLSGMRHDIPDVDLGGTTLPPVTPPNRALSFVR
jgi:hypothetical protein